MGELHQLHERLSSEFETLRKRVATLERIEAEVGALREREQRWRDLVEVSTDWFWETAPDGKFTHASPSFLALSGLSMAQLGQMTRKDLRADGAHDTASESDWRAHQEVLDRHLPFSGFTCSFRDREGALHYVSSSGKPVFGKEGAFLGYRGASHDATAQTEAGLESERARRSLQDALDCMPAGVYLFDANERCVSVNRHAYAMLPEYVELFRTGAAYEDMMRFAYRHRLMGGEDEQLDEERWVQRRLERFRNPPEYQEYRRYDGRWIRGYDRRTFDGGTVSIRFDITREVERDARSRKTEDQFRHLIEEMYLPMLVHRDFKPLFANRACADLFGEPTVEAFLAVPDTKATFLPEELGRAERSYADRMAGRPAQLRYERTLVRPDGSRREVEAVANRILWEGAPAMLVTLRDLTDAKNAAQALVRSEARFRKLFEESLFGMLVHRNREPIYVNPAFARLFGYDSAAEVMALDSIDYWVEPGSVPRVRQYAEARLHHGEAPRQYVFRGRRKDGTNLWIQNTVTTVEWEGELAILATMSDVTGLIEAEDALRDSENRFKDFAEVASDWFWETGPDHRFTFISERFADVSGVPMKALIGKTRRELAHAMNPGVDWDAHLKDLDARRPFRGFVYASRDRSGTLRYARIGGKPNFTHDGVFLGYRGTGTDITGEMEAQSEAKRAHALLVDAIESMPAAFALYDHEDRLVLFNSMTREMFAPYAQEFRVGRKYEEILRMAARSGLHAAALGREETWIEQRLAMRVGAKESLVIGLADGRWLRSLDKRTSEGGTVSIRLDITELKQAERALRESEERFRDFAEIASDWFWETGSDLRFTYFSERFAERAGLRPEGSIGHTRWDLARASADDDRWAQHRMDMEQRRAFRDFVYSYRVGDGSVRHARISGKPVFDVAGAFLGYRGTGSNITAEVEAHQKAERAHARLVDAIEAIPAAFFLFDAERRLVLTNQRALDQFPEMKHLFVPDTTHAELIRHIAEHGLVAGSGERPEAWIAERLASFGAPTESIEQFYLPSRSWMQVLNRKTRDGGTVSVRVDITNLKNREEALRKSEERFRGLAEGSIQAIIVHRGANPVFVNQAFVDMFAFPSADEAYSIDMKNLPYIAERERPRAREYIAARLGGGGAPSRYRFEGVRLDSRPIWAEVVASVVSWDGESAILATYTDVTDYVRAEQARQQSEENYRDLVDGSIQGVTISREFVPLYLNAAAARIFGFASSEEMMTLPSILALAKESDRPRLREHIAHPAGDATAARPFTFPGVRRDGGEIWVEAFAKAIEWKGAPAVQSVYYDITERVHALEALRESEERFRRYFELPLIGMCVTSPDFRYLQVNAKLCDMVGYNEDELLGMSWTQLTHQEHLEPSRDALAKLSSREWSMLSWDNRYIRKDGSLIDVTLSSAPLLRADGSVSAFVTLVQDISFRKQAEEQLRAQQMLLQTVFNAIPLWVSVKNTSGEYLMVNEKFERDTGISVESFRGRTIMDAEFYPLAIRQRILESDRTVVETGQPVLVPSCPLRLPDGREEIQRTIKVPLFGDGNHVEGIVTVAEDITERERTQEALRSSRELLQTVFDALPVWVSVKDRDGRYMMVNRKRIQDAGVPSEAFIGNSVQDLQHLPEDVRRESVRRDRWVIERGESLEAAFEFVDAHGRTRWQHTIRVPLRGPHGETAGLVAVDEDITERRNLEEQLRQSQKMEAIGQLAGGVAHDFNNLLQIISGYCQFAVNEVGADSPVGRDLREVLEATERGSHLTRQLLAFGRRHALHREHVNLNDVVLSLARMLKRLFEDNIELVVVPSPEAGYVLADASMMQQVLMNLCLNARDAMPMGGVLSIEMDHAEYDAAFCDANRWAQPGNFARIVVRDTGHGIAPEHRERIFEPFFTTKAQGKGTGLGLAMAYGIVKQHEGFIHVESEPGKGAQFTIHLPVSKGEDEAEGGSAAVPEGGHETILIVEDEPRVRDMAARVLRNAGYAVHAASDGEEALSLFESLRGKVDLVVLDVVMPRKDGRAVYESLRGQRFQSPVLICSGNSAGMMNDKVAKDPRVRLLQKPYLAADLLSQVRAMLDEPVA